MGTYEKQNGDRCNSCGLSNSRSPFLLDLDMGVAVFSSALVGGLREHVDYILKRVQRGSTEKLQTQKCVVVIIQIWNSVFVVVAFATFTIPPRSGERVVADHVSE